MILSSSTTRMRSFVALIRIQTPFSLLAYRCAAFQWYVHPEHASAFRPALRHDSAVVLFDDVFAHREAQACALARGFGGEKRFEDFLHVLRQSYAGVLEPDDH